ncbi:hypothetical protein [Nocardioides convexus]|uniref:hypothetical protein n=1 Tax=Nocardioides convexus TaxID=2712224 RepID=UPI0031012A41
MTWTRSPRSTRSLIAEVLAVATGIPIVKALRGGVHAAAQDGGRACTSASSARTRRSRRSRGRSVVPVRGSRTPSVPVARSSSPARPASGRRGCPRRSPSSSSATRTR